MAAHVDDLLYGNCGDGTKAINELLARFNVGSNSGSKTMRSQWMLMRSTRSESFGWSQSLPESGISEAPSQRSSSRDNLALLWLEALSVSLVFFALLCSERLEGVAQAPYELDNTAPIHQSISPEV